MKNRFAIAFSLLFLVVALLSLPVAYAIMSEQDQSADSSAEEETDSTVREYLVCPDGSYESSCTRQEVEAAISRKREDFLTLNNKCLYRVEARCFVDSHGVFASPEQGGRLLWQKMHIEPNDGPYTHMVVLFELDADEARLIGLHQIEGTMGAPDMVINSDDLMLVVVPGIWSGSGAGNADLLLARDRQGWRKIRSEPLIDEVNANLPKGFEIHNNARFLYQEMFVHSLVWRESDGHCCATGGNAFINFEIDGDRLRLSGMTFRESRPTGKEYSYPPEESDSSQAR